MNKFRFTINVLAIAIFTFAFASMAQAQATRTWVSGVGDDVNPCSRTAPCKTFPGAISKTAVNGEINCLDPAGFGTVTITKSINIICQYTEGGVLNAGVNGVSIAFDSFAGTDTAKAVRLRGLDINGTGAAGSKGIRITGALAGSKVYIEDSVVDGQGSGLNSIEDVRTGTSTFLAISNTVVRNSQSNGIFIKPASGSNTISASLTNVKVYSASGAALSAGAGANVTAAGCTFSGSATGVFADNAGGNATQIALDNCQITSNGTGINASSGGVNIFVSNSTIMFNGTISVTTGTITSYGNNMTGGTVFSNNGAVQR